MNLVTLKKKFDLIIASDVLEHIKDDKASVKNWNKLLKKNGQIICFVPAFKVLWSNHDVVNQHYRRYGGSGLRRVFEQNGFKILRKSFWNNLLFFPIFAIRQLERILKKGGGGNDQLKGSSKIMNFILAKLLMCENRVVKSFNMPVGVSLFILAKKNT